MALSEKKTFFVLPTLRAGGAERVVSLLSTEMQRTGSLGDISVILLDGKDPAYTTLADVRDLGLGFSKTLLGKFIQFIRRVRRITLLINKEKPDNVISFMESANFPTISACFFSGILNKLTVSIRNNLTSFPLYYRLVIPVLYSFPQRIVFPAQRMLNNYRGHWYGSVQGAFIPNPIDLSLIDEMASRKEKYSFLPNEEFILGVGRLTDQKGFESLLLVFSKLPDTGLKLIILGEGQLRYRLEQLAMKLGVSGRVILPGTVRNPFFVYSRAKCLVLTSKYEGWPNVLNEARAAGCPVISYDCDYGPSEMIIDAEDGFLVRLNDEQGLIDRVNLILSSKKDRDRIVYNGRLMSQFFGLGEVVRQWVECLNSYEASYLGRSKNKNTSCN